jgi:molecular chaperone GrpE
MTNKPDAETSANGQAPESEVDGLATEAGQPDTAKPADEDPAAALEAALAEAQTQRDNYLRLAADMENLRKRTVRDVENARKYGVERFAADVLAVADSLEMGLESGSTATVETLLEGKAATLKLLLGSLEKAGAKIIDPEGEPFDPQQHEAMAMQPSDVAEPGSVLTVIQKGYELNGRLLRPAMVLVASEPE